MTFLRGRSWIFWVTCSSFLHPCSSFLHPCLGRYAMETASFLQHCEPTAASVRFFLLQLPHPSQSSVDWRELGPCSGLGFDLREYCSWLDLLSRPPEPSLYWNEVVLPFYLFCVRWSSTFHFLLELVPCIHSSAVWHKRPHFGPNLVFNMPSSLSLIITSFPFNVRAVGLFFALEPLEAIVGLLIGLISMLLCLREQGGPSIGSEMGKWLEQSENTWHWLMKFTIFHGSSYKSNIKEH